MNSSSSKPSVDLLIALVRQHMIRKGLDRKQLGHLLCSGKNRGKTFRRLDEFLTGERFRPDFVERLGQSLQIPPEQLAFAWEVHEEQEEERRFRRAQRAEREAMERRGPHLWGLLPKNYHPSLITVLGAEFFLLVGLPEEFAEFPHYEMTVEVGKAVREHYQNHRRCELIGYEFRRSFGEVFRFSVDGEFVEQCATGMNVPRTFVRVGGVTVETSINGFRGISPKSGAQ